MRCSVIRITKEPIKTRQQRVCFRASAYQFLLSEIHAVFPYVPAENHDAVESQMISSAEAGSQDLVILPFLKDDLGKPFLPGYPEILFNLSHSRNGFAAAIVAARSETDAVGIDIEIRFPYRAAFARKICHADELRALAQSESEERKQAILNLIWSRKEAILKCEGRGIRSDLSKINTFCVDPSRYRIAERQTEDYTLVTCVRISQ